MSQTLDRNSSNKPACVHVQVEFTLDQPMGGPDLAVHAGFRVEDPQHAGLGGDLPTRFEVLQAKHGRREGSMRAAKTLREGQHQRLRANLFGANTE